MSTVLRICPKHSYVWVPLICPEYINFLLQSIRTGLDDSNTDFSAFYITKFVAQNLYFYNGASPPHMPMKRKENRQII